MTHLAYLASLVLVIACLALTDRRWRLFLWADPRRAGAVLAAGIGFFLLWDAAALRLSLYERGASAYMTGIELAPEFPLEELFFVAFLPYLTMVLHGLAVRLLATPHRGAPVAGEAREARP
jgi:lycopene cyclase domain-containing protein